MNNAHLHKGIIFSCDLNGLVTEVIFNNLPGVFLSEGHPLIGILDKDSVAKCLTFLLNIRNQNAVFNWELNILRDGSQQSLYFSGSLKGEQIIIVGGENPDNLQYFEKLLEINNQQTDILRSLIKENVAAKLIKDDKEKIFDEITRLNNELVNAERELAKKNAQLHKLNTKLHNIVMTDDLTGLYNRRCFFQKIEEEILKAKKLDQQLSIAMVDMNNFKYINDTYGHDAGDRILRDFAELSRKMLRSHDLVFRIGGDEFLILLTDSPRERAELALARLNKALQEQGGVSLAYGIETLDMEADIDIDKYIKVIDDKMYKNKKAAKRKESQINH